MQTESARMTTAHEASFRIQAPNSRERAAKVIALDKPSAALVDELAKKEWRGAQFFTALAFSSDKSPGGAEGSMKAWLNDLAGRTMDLVSEIERSDFVVCITTAGEDARAASVIADACGMFHKSLIGLIVPNAHTSDADVEKSLRYLRPYSRMLVVSQGLDYIETMLTALRA
jgi:hypothetical protein